MRPARLTLVAVLAFGSVACGEDDPATETAADPCPAVDLVDDNGWTTIDGCPVATTSVHSHPGPAECGWELVDYLILEPGVYHWDPVNLLSYVDGQTRNRTLKVDDLPGAVADTGHRRGEEQLWLDPDDDEFAYVVTGSFAERYVLDRDGAIVCPQ